MRKTAWLGVVLTTGVALYAAWHFTRPKTAGPELRKDTVQRGDVVMTVSASGTLSAVTTVRIGSQVSGIISALHADFNSNVKNGELLAELDPTPFQATVDQRRADLERARAEQRNADLAWARVKRLREAGISSQDESDAAETGRDTASAAVKQSEASLRQAQVNLGNTRITSPIDGVVVDRQYDVGQTVAASFQAPVLFTIAQDLTRMQVLASVDEADIGGVKVGQGASFTVDAFPDRPFRGTVSQVRLSPQTVQNVVTYPVIIDVPNPEGRLMPGMTTNVQIPVEERKGVLRVANAALRFQPDPSLVLADKQAEEAPKGGAPGGGGRRGPRRGSVVYVLVEGGKLRAIPVKTSITDGSFTAIEDGALTEGQEVVVGLATSRAQQATGGLTQGPMGGGRPRM